MPAAAHRPDTIRVVEDDDAIRALVAEALRDEGIRVVAAPRHADALAAVRDDEEGVEWPKEEVGDREEVAGPDLMGVVAQERWPRLPAATRWAGLAQVALDRRPSYADTELEELAPDALRAPHAVGRRHLPDQGHRLGREGRAVRRGDGPGSPTPVAAEQLAVPAQERIRPDDEQRRPPRADAARQQDQQRTIARRTAGSPDAVVQDGELMAQERVLGHQRRLAPRQIGEGTGYEGRGGRTGGGQKSPMEALRGGAAEGDQAAQQADRHGGGSSFVYGATRDRGECSRALAQR
jgi:CheY-like chemotaxis protein